MKKTMKLNAWVCTDGHGHWSHQERFVKVYRLEVVTYEDHRGVDVIYEVRAHFTRATWDTRKHGLIYTDRSFLTGLKKHLRSLGLVCGLNYTEQGMQGDAYVSLDPSKAFIRSWHAVQSKRR